MAVSISFYEKFIVFMGDDTFDMDTDVWDIILMTPTHVFTAANTIKANISANEIPTGNGYTQGLETLLSVTWLEAAGVTTFDCADIVWSATGGPIPTSGNCDAAVIYSETATQNVDALMCTIDFGQNETAGDGTDFKITPNTSGIFTIT